MQLVGNIEDLGLGEILQIVSFSRKSGTLRLNSRKREGCIVFKDGNVVRASSSAIKEGVCDVLLKEGVLTQEQLREAKRIQESDGFKDTLGTVLIKDFRLSSDKIEDAVRGRIEKIVYSLFLWQDGNFVFELGDFVETPDVISRDPLHYTLPVGMNPQFLAMEGSRLLDEFRREGSIPEETPVQEEVPGLPEEEPVVPVRPAPSVEGEGTVFIVDDDPLIRGFIRNQLVRIGFKAVAFSQADTALDKLGELIRKGERPIVVADMFMPRMDGEGSLGGIELLSHIREDFAEIPVIIITEHSDSKIEKEATDLKVSSFLLKPKKLQFKDDVVTPEVASFIETLSRHIRRLTGRAEKAEPQFSMQDYLKELEDGESFLEPRSEEPRVEESKGLMLLKEMLVELSRPLSVSEIVLLILRFSSEMMNRAVVFAVKKDGMAGLGQYGIEIAGDNPDKRVRKMSIPLNEPSILKETIDRKTAVVKRLDPLPWNDYIVRELGGYKPVEAFAAPIVVQGKVPMILYGDNAPKGDRIGDTSTIEIFLAQASMALERLIYEKKISGERDR